MGHSSCRLLSFLLVANVLLLSLIEMYLWTDNRSIMEYLKGSNHKHHTFFFYLPHSGYNNQRVALENALLLSHILNATLVVPPLFLGHSKLLPWKESGDLQRSLRLADMINDSHAELLPARTVSWKSLFDLKKFQHIAPIISLETFFELVEKSSSENVELWIVNDLERYSYLLAEDIPGADINLLWNNAVHRAVGKDHYEWADHGKLVLNRYRDGQDDKNSNSVQHNEKRQLPDSHFGKLATIFILISSDSKGDNQSREFYDPKKQKFPDYDQLHSIDTTDFTNMSFEEQQLLMDVTGAKEFSVINESMPVIKHTPNTYRFFILNSTKCIHESTGEIMIQHTSGILSFSNMTEYPVPIYAERLEWPRLYYSTPVEKDYSDHSLIPKCLSSLKLVWPALNSPIASRPLMKIMIPLLRPLHNLNSTIDYPIRWVSGDSCVLYINLSKFSHLFNLRALSLAISNPPEIRRSTELSTNQLSLSPPIRIIQFGSMFSRNRIITSYTKTEQIRRSIQQVFTKMDNEVVNHIIDKMIVKIRSYCPLNSKSIQLNSSSKPINLECVFIAVHVRSQDGSFVQRSSTTVNRMVNLISDELNKFTAEASLKYPSIQKPRIILYVATDSPDPHKLELFKPLHDLSDVFLSLRDFSSILQGLNDMDKWYINNHKTSTESKKMSDLLNWIEDIRANQSFSGRSEYISKMNIRRNEEQQYLSNYLSRIERWNIVHKKESKMNSNNPFVDLSWFARMWIPFVEQYVCGGSDGFIGTRGSTFSDLISRMYDMESMKSLFVHLV